VEQWKLKTPSTLKTSMQNSRIIFFWILSKLKDCIFVFFLDRAVHVDLFFNRGVYNKYSPNYRIRLDIYNRRGYNLVLFIKVKERDDSKS
jgi:hypothetical protein